MKGADWVQERPNPPLYITVGEETYTLRGNSSVQQSSDVINSFNLASQHSVPLDGQHIKVSTESILDLESDQKITRCEVCLLTV